MILPEIIALCNGVRGLKLDEYIISGNATQIALCNGVRGLKSDAGRDVLSII